MSDLWLEAGEFVRRWWKVILPVVVLAIAIPVWLIASGDDDSEGVPTVASVESSDPADTTTGLDANAADSSDKKNDKPGNGEKAEKKPSEAGSEGPGNGGTVSEGPVSPYGPPGSPVGGVPPGAPLSANEQAVAKTLTNFLRAISRGDGPQACAQLSPEGRERVEREVHEAAPETQGTPCEGAIVLYQGGYGASARNPTITDVSVSGDQATATGPPNKRRGDLAKYENVWLIDNYGWG